MKMKRILSSILALTICMVSSSNAFAATVDNKENQASEDFEFTVQANQDQLILINKLKGKKMSRLEFYESVFPDLVPKLSDNQKKRYANESFEDLTKTGTVTSTPGTGSSTLTSMPNNSSSSTTPTPNYIDLTLDTVDITQDSDDRSISSTAKMQEVLPIPPAPLDMVIDVSIINSDGWLDAYNSTAEDDVTSAEVEATVYNPVKGLQYVATGYFSFIDWANMGQGTDTVTSKTLTSK